jgi:type II secretory pathway component PulF
MTIRRDALAKALDCCADLRDLPEEVREELIDHLEDACGANRSDDRPEVEVLVESLQGMGDMTRLAAKLRKVHSRTVDPTFLLAGTFALLLGIYAWFCIGFVPGMEAFFERFNLILPGMTSTSFAVAGIVRMLWPILPVAMIVVGYMVYRSRGNARWNRSTRWTLGLASAGLSLVVLSAVVSILLPILSLALIL